MKAITPLFILASILLSACAKPNVAAVQSVVADQPQVSAKSFSYDLEKDVCKSVDGDIGFNSGSPGECVDSSNSNLDGHNLSGLNLKGAKFEMASLKNSNLSKADLSGANLMGVDLSGADLTEAILTNTKMDATRVPASAAIVVSSWTKCADENGMCNFTGTKLVRYGEHDVYVTQTFTGGVSCSNSVFGDPLYGTIKHCDTSSAVVHPQDPTINSLAWSFCADENGQCNFSGSKLVRYGAGSTFVMKVVSGGINCSNSIFGDPFYGTVKRCDVLANLDLSLLPSENSWGWKFCSDEHGHCNFSGTRLVRYGSGNTFVMKVAKNGIGCSNEVFGDPFYGTFKRCEILANLDILPVIKNGAPVWGKCAVENGQCSFAGTKLVRYGEVDHYYIQTATNGINCSNSIFGDPLYGTVKHCDIAEVQDLRGLLPH